MAASTLGLTHAQATTLSTCVPESGAVLASPECPALTVVGQLPSGLPNGDANTTGPGPTPSVECTIRPVAQAAYLGASENMGGVTVPQFTAGGLSFGPWSVPIPPASLLSEAVGGTGAACSAEPGWNGNLEPIVSLQVCQVLFAQILDTTDPSAPRVYWVQAPGGDAACANGVPNDAPYASAGEMARIYSNLPATGAGTWFGNSPATVYTGEYDLVGYAFGWVDGSQILGSNCIGGASVCSNDLFED
ncbi:MAG TPA: hypothetical protein VFC09_05135 [Candidatus Dormibacteraeota bacterium]|nr:hypothetical protein [Candidatus Dormibacteraeota bacterium]